MSPMLARALRNIGSVDDVQSIQEALTIIRSSKPETAAETTPTSEPVPVVADKALNLVQKLISDLNAALEEIEWLRDYCDKDLESTILSLQAELTDYPTCKQAAEVYDIDWFADLPFSDDGLKRIATMFLSTTEPFLGESGNPVWNEISVGNIATFNRLSELVKGSGAPADRASET